MATKSMTNALFTVMDTRRDGILTRDEWNQMAFTAIHNNPLTQPKNFAVAPPGVPPGVTYTSPPAAQPVPCQFAAPLAAPSGYAAYAQPGQPMTFGGPAAMPYGAMAPAPAYIAAPPVAYAAASPAYGATLQPAFSQTLQPAVSHTLQPAVSHTLQPAVSYTLQPSVSMSVAQPAVGLQPSVSWASQPVTYAAPQPMLQPSVSWTTQTPVTYAAPQPMLQQSISMAETGMTYMQQAPTYVTQPQGFGAPTVTYASSATAPVAYVSGGGAVAPPTTTMAS